MVGSILMLSMSHFTCIVMTTAVLDTSSKILSPQHQSGKQMTTTNKQTLLARNKAGTNTLVGVDARNEFRVRLARVHASDVKLLLRRVHVFLQRLVLS